MVGQPRHRRLWSLALWSLVIGLAWLLFGQQVNGQSIVQLDLTAALPVAQPVHGHQATPPGGHRQASAPTPQRSPRSSPAASTGALTPTSPPPARAAGAVAFALAQRGKPYVWGAEGPDAYDCSGLVWRAWQHAGLAWERINAAVQWQWLHGHQVPASQLRPGDLLFYANNPRDPTSIHHVAMQVGQGRMVEAPPPASRSESYPSAGTGSTALRGQVSEMEQTDEPHPREHR